MVSLLFGVFPLVFFFAEHMTPVALSVTVCIPVCFPVSVLVDAISKWLDRERVGGPVDESVVQPGCQYGGQDEVDG